MAEPTETEVKLRVENLEGPRETLVRLGAELVTERHLEDNVLYDDEALTMANAGAVLRIRRTPRKGTLTFKGPRRFADGIKTREERQSGVEKPDEVHAIFKALGIRPVFRYQKYREAWSYRGQEVVLDETPIGTFLEIEGDAEGIRAVTADLGLDPSKYLADSYVALFFAQGGEGDMVFSE